MALTTRDIQDVLDSGEFHHATYREIGKLWEGLYIYVKEDNGFNGFKLLGCVPKDSPEQDKCYDLVRHTGVSVGARGQG